jgi:mono/diheme cytochrome c family protein
MCASLCALLSVPALAATGAEVFETVCADCHGKAGEGKPQLAPPLKGNPFVTSGSAQDVQSVVKNGRVGNAKKYPQIPQGMPGQPVYDDDLDAVVKYVKEDLQNKK